MNTLARWIWPDSEERLDVYAEFVDFFEYSGENARIRISADSNYALYLNGALVDSGQYPDFPYDKVYDELELTRFCRAGENRVAIVVWHYGDSNMGYYPGNAALLYDLTLNGRSACLSGGDTLSRVSPMYENGRAKLITTQLGFGFRCDLNRRDDWMNGGGEGFGPSVIVDQILPLRPRPVEKCIIGERIRSECIRSEGKTKFLFDLGREESGYLTLKVVSDTAQTLLISYGEHIADGGVRRLVGGRDFSVEVVLRPGVNEYVNPFRRLGLRYLEVETENPVEIEYLSVLPVSYPLTRREPPVLDGRQRQIYDVCVRTLELCMHDHYEDTPWREQALYALDSRNQMLCGYHAFGETRFPRANLQLISRDNRADGLLSICTPSGRDLTIPSFSLHYFMAVEEYLKYSGDRSLFDEVRPKLESVIQVFIDRMEDDCVPIFTDPCHWNFYEWSKGLDGALGKQKTEEKRFDAALNCLFSLALQAMAHMAGPDDGRRYGELAERVNAGIAERFLDASDGLFFDSSLKDGKSVLVNALAILCGAAKEEKALATRLTDPDSGLTPVTLSMTGYLYDALLKADAEGSREWILDSIAVKYGRMLDAGATSVWETELGEKDFNCAGSLCHGWSALPVYYYSILTDDR